MDDLPVLSEKSAVEKIGPCFTCWVCNQWIWTTGGYRRH